MIHIPRLVFRHTCTVYRLLWIHHPSRPSGKKCFKMRLLFSKEAKGASCFKPWRLMATLHQGRQKPTARTKSQFIKSSSRLKITFWRWSLHLKHNFFSFILTGAAVVQSVKRIKIEFGTAYRDHVFFLSHSEIVQTFSCIFRFEKKIK